MGYKCRFLIKSLSKLNKLFSKKSLTETFLGFLKLQGQADWGRIEQLQLDRKVPMQDSTLGSL